MMKFKSFFSRFSAQKSKVIADYKTYQVKIDTQQNVTFYETIKDPASIRTLDCRNQPFLGQGKGLATLEQFPNLEVLYAGNCGITDISPLKNLKNLQSLLLENNQIEDISVLAELPLIRELILSDNQITDASAITKLPKLSNLGLDGNELTGLDELFAYFDENHDLTNVALMGFDLFKG